MTNPAEATKRIRARTAEEASRVADELLSDIEGMLIDAIRARIGGAFFLLADVKDRLHGYTRGGLEDWTTYSFDGETILEVSPVRFEESKIIETGGRKTVFAWQDVRKYPARVST